MATSEDVLQYLLTKLQSEDGWSCANLAWNEDRLAVIADQFSSFEGSVKSKLLLSFLAMSPRVISACRDEMLKLLRLARRDSDEWVRLFASVLGPFPDNQTITLEADSNASEVLEEIEVTLTKSTGTGMGSAFVPHEYRYLNKSIMEQTLGQSDPSKMAHDHFKLLKNPRATSQLRADILLRAETDLSATGSVNRDKATIHRQASTSNSSLSFVPSQRVPSTPKTVPVPGLMQRRYREKGTKLLEIDEVPLAGRRKRKISELDIPASKKLASAKQPNTPVTPSPTPNTPQETTPLTTPTPDYAAALGNDDSSIQPHTPSIYNSNFSGFPSLNSPLTPNPSFVSPPPTSATPTTHPLSTRTQPLSSLTSSNVAGSSGNQGEKVTTAPQGEIRTPDYLKKMLTTKAPTTVAPSALPVTSQPTTVAGGVTGGVANPIASVLQQQLASLSANILGTTAAQNIVSNQNRQQMLQNQQRILMERQKLLQQIQQQNLLQASQQLQQQQQQQQQSSVGAAPTPSSSSSTTVNPQQAPAAKQPSKGLKLSRQQLAVAQEIFREAPHLNKQQKALILAFMAGSRDNPLPGHNVISIKLNQRQQQEMIQTPEGEKRARNVQLETLFEMNYTTGQWRKLQVKRPLD